MKNINKLSNKNAWDDFFYQSVRTFTESYAHSPNHEVTIFNFLYISLEYFRGTKNLKGTNFTRKHLLKNQVQKAFRASNLNALIRMEEKAEKLIMASLEHNVYQPAYSKLKAEIIYKQAVVAQEKDYRDQAISLIKKGITFLEDLTIEFPAYVQAEVLLSEFRKFQTAL